MSKTRRRFTAEFKRDAVRRMVEDGIQQAQVARELDVSANTLAKWKQEYLEDPEHSFPGLGRMKPADAELARVKKENARLREELIIVKKAAAYFAKESR